MKIISNLSNSAAFGLDELDTFAIKLVKEEITPALTHILNLSISQGKFPDYWKTSKISPIHKKNDQLNPENYRPVAIIPVLSKVLERAVHNQLIQYIKENNLLNPNHHAYRDGYSTSTAVIEMIDTWIQAVEDGQLAGACFLDMSAAFDVVDHTILLDKMKIYGFTSDVIQWFDSYLSNRKQAVSVNGCLSELLSVESGVPQGSILGPLLYTLFVNELPDTIASNSSMSCYADDTTLTCKDSSHSELSRKLTEHYQSISKFMVDNRLKLNDDKSKLLVMSSSSVRIRSQSANMVTIQTDTEEIKPTSTVRLLGCHLQENLKWTQHIRDNEENLMQSLNKRLYAVSKISKISSFKTRKMIANGIFHSKLVYMINVWSSCSKEMIQALQIIQNRVAKMITRNWNNKNVENLNQIGWLSVSQLAFHQSVVMIHQVRVKNIPENIFRMYNWEYSHQTRQATSKKIKPIGLPKLELGKKSFKWRAAENYNSLPTSITEITDIQKFKIQSKKWTSHNIPYR